MAPFRLFLSLLALAGTTISALATVIGGPLIREGLEIIPSTEPPTQLDHQFSAVVADTVFLLADVHATKNQAHGFAEHAFIPYLTISYSLTKEGAPTFKRAGLLYPVATKSGPRYVGSAEMAGPGTYHLTYIVSPPSSHGMMRQTGNADGVPDWWNPINVSWNFAYPGSNTLSAK
jgi:periplasmic iron binding protein